MGGISVDPFWFLASFLFGLAMVWMFKPEPEYVIRYPTPENAGQITYKDINEVCYKYRAEKVSCPADKSKVKKIAVQ